MKNHLKQKIFTLAIMLFINYSSCVKRDQYGNIILERYNPKAGPDLNRMQGYGGNLHNEYNDFRQNMYGNRNQQFNIQGDRKQEIKDMIAKGYVEDQNRKMGYKPAFNAVNDQLYNKYDAILNKNMQPAREVNRLYIKDYNQKPVINYNVQRAKVNRPKVHDKCKSSYSDFDSAFAENVNVPGSKGIELILANGKFLGKGSFGEVKEIAWMIHGKKESIAVKKINLNKDQRGLKRELRYGLDYDIATIPNMHGCLQVGDYVYIIQEKLYKDLTAFNVTHKIKNRNVSQRASNYISIMEALKGISDQQIVHSDLKPANMMAVDENVTMFKAIDMGMADAVDAQIHGGTPLYESIDKKNYGTRLRLSDDSWAIGLILSAIEGSESALSRNIPSHCIQDRMTDSCYQQLLANALGQIKRDHDQRFKDLIKKMLDKNPNTRITIGAAIAEIKQIYPGAQGVQIPANKPPVDSIMRRMERADDNDVRKYAYLKEHQQRMEENRGEAALNLQTMDQDTRQEIRKVYNQNQGKNNEEVTRLLDQRVQELGLDRFKYGYLKQDRIQEILQKGQKFIMNNKEYIQIGPYKKEEKKPQQQIHKRKNSAFDNNAARKNLIDPAYAEVHAYDDNNRKHLRQDAYMKRAPRQEPFGIIGDRAMNYKSNSRKMETDFLAKVEAQERGQIPMMGKQEMFDNYKDHLMNRMNIGIQKQLNERKSFANGYKKRII